MRRNFVRAPSERSANNLHLVAFIAANLCQTKRTVRTKVVVVGLPDCEANRLLILDELRVLMITRKRVIRKLLNKSEERIQCSAVGRIQRDETLRGWRNHQVSRMRR